MAKDSKPSSKSARSAREEAAAARAAAMEKQRKRQRTINLAIGGVIAVVVLAIVGGAVIMSRETKQQSGAVADPSAPIPVGVFAAGEEFAFGVPVGSNPDAPVVEVWEDFQCPACGAFEAAMGSTLLAKAEAGEIFLVTRPTTFLDRTFASDASRRAAAAYGCAIDAGQGYPYKEKVYANQPEREGDGWTDEQLTGFAQEIGLTGETYTTFEQCFVDRTYVPWSTNSTEEFYASGATGTPTVKINGEAVATSDVVDQATFDELIKKAAAGQ